MLPQAEMSPAVIMAVNTAIAHSEFIDTLYNQVNSESCQISHAPLDLKNSEVPIREQLVTQIVLGIVSNDLKIAERLAEHARACATLRHTRQHRQRRVSRTCETRLGRVSEGKRSLRSRAKRRDTRKRACARSTHRTLFQKPS